MIVVWWIACFLWSGGWLFLKVGLQDLPPISFAALRLALAALVLVPIVLAQREWRTVPRRDVITIATSGVLLLGVNYILVFWGAQFVPSALTALLQTMSPVFGFMFGVALGAERFTVVRALAIVLGLIGVAIVSGGQGAHGEIAVLGSLAIVLGSACVASAYAIVKGRGAHMSPALLVTGQTVAALVPLTVIALAIEDNPATIRWTTQAVIALVYLGIMCSVVAFWLNYWLLKRLTATTVLATGLVQPFIAAILGAIWLGERLGAQTLAGGACILLGATIILRRDAA